MSPVVSREPPSPCKLAATLKISVSSYRSCEYCRNLAVLNGSLLKKHQMYLCFGYLALPANSDPGTGSSASFLQTTEKSWSNTSPTHQGTNDINISVASCLPCRPFLVTNSRRCKIPGRQMTQMTSRHRVSATRVASLLWSDSSCACLSHCHVAASTQDVTAIFRCCTVPPGSFFDIFSSVADGRPLATRPS